MGLELFYTKFKPYLIDFSELPLFSICSSSNINYLNGTSVT